MFVQIKEFHQLKNEQESFSDEKIWCYGAVKVNRFFLSDFELHDKPTGISKPSTSQTNKQNKTEKYRERKHEMTN